MSEKAASRTSVHDVVLLPCPFCGSTDLNGPHISEYVGDHYSPSWWVDCENCPGSMELRGADVSGLVEAWNKRADYADGDGIDAWKFSDERGSVIYKIQIFSSKEIWEREYAEWMGE